MHPALDPLLSDQSGVVSREQALNAGVTENEIKRLCRRRELVPPVHRGVYVDHTGEPTWQQRAWAVVLVQARRTTALRLAAALEGRERIGRGLWMRNVLKDVAAGACSVLEHGYLTRVERAHGLTPARRQVRDRLGAGVGLPRRGVRRRAGRRAGRATLPRLGVGPRRRPRP